ncbi:bifunctional metallophosphatase/5'-nucleotidase [Alteromonas flava]|uniref:bifunctional metallophosphatase/5'-nucleotidase n=1 Tax=Alteromonas flava TaxID=2048003 RepID=UPI000C28DFA4|nr:5'-nucleotidase C-terminal domain-containing protein [Alteromonas flava]
MNKRLCCLLIVIGLISFSSTAKQQLRIIYAADLPIIGTQAHGDYAELATLLREQRAQQDIMFVFGGASLAPSPLASFDSGSHIIDILNLLAPDVMSVTKREFSYFEDELILRSYEASFPLLLTNAVDSYTQQPLDGLYTHIVIAKNGLKVGFISILSPQISEEYLLQRARILPPRESVERFATELSGQGVDLIVLLHSDSFSFIQELLDDATIHLAIQSDPNSLTRASAETKQRSNQLTVDQNGQAAIINVTLEEPGFEGNNSGIVVDYSLHDLAEFKPNPQVNAAIAHYQHRLESQLSVPLSTITQGFSTKKEIVRQHESSFGNFITDAMRQEADSDIAVINGGVIRGNREYQPNTIFTQRDLLLELPFRARLVELTITGEQLKIALENGVSLYQQGKGRFLQVSGMAYAFSPLQPVGQRVSNITVNGQPLIKDKIYRLATTDYLYRGGDGFAVFKGLERNFSNAPTSPLIADIVARNLKRNKHLSVATEQRITRVE